MLPWIIAGVFLVTFVVVCAIAYVFVGTDDSKTLASSTDQSPATARFSNRPSTPGWQFVLNKSVLLGARARGQEHLLLYRVLMFTTGLVGLLASTLMFLEARFTSVQAVPGLVVFLLSLLAIWNGVYPRASVKGATKAADPDSGRDKPELRVSDAEPPRTLVAGKRDTESLS